MLIKLIHRYVGLVLCLITLSISVSGVILVWKKEVLRLSIDDAGEVVDTRLLAGAINQIEASYAADEVIFIQLYSEDLSIHKVFLSGRRYAWHNQRGDRLQVWSGNQRWEGFLLDFHHRFLLGNKVGLNIVGISGLSLLVVMFFGGILWWPRRRLLALGLLPKAKQPETLIRSHGNMGIVFTLPISVLVITGVVLVYPVESRLLFLDGDGQSSAQSIQKQRLEIGEGLPSWARMIEIAADKFPESRVRSVQPSSLSSQKRTVNVQQKGAWHRLGRTSLRFYSNGDLVIDNEFKQSKSKRALGLSYPFHTAKLGLFYRMVVTIVGLAFAALSILGLLSYLRRYAK